MKLSDLAKKMTRSICMIALFCIIGSVIYYRSVKFLPFFFGVLIGSCVSVLKVILLDRAVDKTLNMEQKRAGGYAGIQYLLRFGLSGAVLVLGAVIPQISLWGTVAGIFAYQLATYSLKFSSKA
ncbi:ATP synthase subunit I [Blautia liquoris]|uniref:ATP synthase subunit I n=1 Tax=Blautia liquoris TaxID=2779518 RepID=A0A7M2RKF7_9FIRM|nr:ATP synthase subunit I [Blautia liquoris]QOV20769.1 ATP synthase subunit I [Blautia liquoris]